MKGEVKRDGRDKMAFNEMCAPAPLASSTGEELPLPYWRLVAALGALGALFLLALSAMR
jgi:hypothetical protein